MNKSRTIGNNVSLLLQGHDRSNFGNVIKLSEIEVDKLCDGRLVVSDDTIDLIAKFFKCDKSDIITDKGEDAYQTLIHNSSKFTHRDNQEFILDLIDNYIDFAELM